MASHSGQAVSAERRKQVHLRDPSTTGVAALGREIAQTPESVGWISAPEVVMSISRVSTSASHRRGRLCLKPGLCARVYVCVCV